MRRVALFSLLTGVIAFSFVPRPASAAAGDYNAVWVTTDQGVLKLSLADGSFLLGIDSLIDARAVVVDDIRATIWITTENRQLHAYALDGTRRFSAPLPTVSASDDEDDVDYDEELKALPGLVVNSGNGDVWLGDGNGVHRYTANGNLIDTLLFDRKVRALAFDSTRQRLWVGLKKQITAHDAAGIQQLYIDVGADAYVRDLSVVPATSELWVGLKKEIRRYDFYGGLLLQKPVEHVTRLRVDSDGAGNLWYATKKTVVRINAAGTVLTSVMPFAQEGKVVDIVANSSDQSVWAANQKSIGHVSATGQLLHTLAWPNRLRAIAISLDRIAPQVAIVSPQNGSVVSPQASINLSYSDIGSGVDTSSIAFSVNSLPKTFTCTTAVTGAACTPNEAYVGPHVQISVTVKDLAGNVSVHATVTVKLDTDGDGYADDVDLFPLDPTEWADLDGDGIGDNSDPDRDGDGFANTVDAFPNDPAEWSDLDGDGIGDNSDPDRDGDSYANSVDVFPNDPTEWADLDGDGIGNNGDPDRDNDGYANATDVFPDNPTEWADLDKDGIGNNSDPDRDGDNVANADDVFPDDPMRFKLPVVKITSPGSLITVGATPIAVTGTIDDPQAAVTVNGAPVAHSGGQFQAQVNLTEGFNNIIARAVDSLGSEATASIVVSLDVTPPYITVQSPQDGAVVSSDRISVSGLVNDIVRGTVSETQTNVTVNGVSATVSNRSYLAENVPLQVGQNSLVISASDAVGNTETKTIQVTYQLPSEPRIQLVSGQGQRARILQLLSQPLVTKLETNGTPVASKEVVFRVIQGDGKIGQGTAQDAQAVVTTTNAQGIASARFTLGSRAGQGNHQVRATAVGFSSEVVFHASADTNPGDKIGVIAGNNQRGAVRNPLPSPFVVAVTDVGGNLVQGANVEFRATAGGGTFQNGQAVYSVMTDSDGRASAMMTLGPEVGLDIHRVVATLVGTGATAGFTASALQPGDPGQTKISGVVLDNQDAPVPGAMLRVEGTTREARADNQGQFTITQVPVGPVRLLVDGSTTSRSGEWPTLSFDLVTVAGATNTLPSPIYLVPLNTQSAATVGTQDVTLTLAEVPGFALNVKAGSVTFPDGSKTGRLSVTVVNNDKIPMPPPNGMQPQFIVTIQPVGARFDPPAALTIPNVDGHRPGAEVEMYSYDHDLEEFVTIGWGTVSVDGQVIKSNPGVGVVKAGWHCGSQPSGSGCCTGSGGGGGGCAKCYKRENDQCNDSCVPDDSQTCDKSDPNNKCITGQCQGGSCTDKPVADGTGCFDATAQMNQCRVWQCKNGVCDGSAFTADGTNCDPYDNNECTTGRCEAGTCIPIPIDVPGATCNAGTNNECMTGKCQGTSCVPEPVSDGTFCSLGSSNSCQVGSCQGGACTPQNVPDGTSCNAGTADQCTEGGFCQNGSCVSGQQRSCDDGNQCTQDSCSSTTGCANTPLTNSTCCSGFAFNPATQGCCGGAVYTLGEFCCLDGCTN